MVRKRWICLALIVLNAVCFCQVCLDGFIDLDDPAYVTDNPFSSGGLSWDNVRWAFGASCYQAGFWIPLTWLSLQMDATLFGPGGAWGFHLTNLLWHLANVVAFFLVLERLTGARWRSAAAAALFAIHPLRVESVTWVTERKDVLSTFFLILAIGFYQRYATKPNIRAYLLTFVSFALGLMAKPTLVTFPFVLLLLDYWPLCRWRLGQAAPEGSAAAPGVAWPRLGIEKIPFFIASAVISLVTWRYSGLIGAIEPLPWGDRFAVALSGYLSYLEKTLWPTDLAAFYPLQIPGAARRCAAGGVLATITALVVRFGRSKPALVVGWLWFLGTLFPVSGIAQTGPQGLADRFTYVPHLGLAIMVVWGLADLTAWRRLSPVVRAGLIGSCFAGLAALTCVQGCYWRNSGILFEHALSVTQKNAPAHFCVAGYWLAQGDLEKAEPHVAKAVEIQPNYALGRFHFGTLLLRREDYARAATQLDAYTRLAPDDPDGFYALALALSKQGRWRQAKDNLERSVTIWTTNPPTKVWRGDKRRREALPLELLGEVELHEGAPEHAASYFHKALALDSELALAHHFLGVALGRRGDWTQAENALHQAVNLEPENASFRAYLAFGFAQQKKTALAAQEYVRVLNQAPDWLQHTSDLALRAITQSAFRDQRTAEELAAQICEATAFKDARALNTLAAVLAAGHDFDAACATLQKALLLTHDPALRAECAARLQLFRQRQPLPTIKQKSDQ